MTCSNDTVEKAVVPTASSELTINGMDATMAPGVSRTDSRTENSLGSISDSLTVPNLLAMDLTDRHKTGNNVEDQAISENCLLSNFQKLSVNDASSLNSDPARESSEGVIDFDAPFNTAAKVTTAISETGRDQLLFLVDEDGDTSLHISIIQEDVQKAMYIIKRAPCFTYLSIQNDFLQTPLHLAAIINSSELVRKLVCAGADVPRQDRDGNSALHIACMHGHLEVVKQLLNPVTYAEVSENKYSLPHMAIPQNVNVKNYEGLTCLHLAVLRQNEDIARLLLEAGADPNIRDSKSGRSALHIAAEHGSVDCVSVLLDYRMTEVDALNYSGHTPSLLAYSREHLNVVRLLTRFGASYGFYYYESDQEDAATSEDAHSDMEA